MVQHTISGEKSMVKKRYMHLSEDILKENPNICEYMAPSLDARQDIVVVEVPKLGKEAATKAITEWGQPKSKITHLIFCTTSGVDMPGADYQLTKLLGLRPSVAFRGPSDTHLSALTHRQWTAQTILPESEGSIEGHLREVGLTFHMLRDVPGLISKSIEKALVEAFQPLGISDYNSIFWIAHPGGPAILDQVEAKLNLTREETGASRHVLSDDEASLKLKPEKMRATRQVLSEHGNMWSATVLFILDEMRSKSAEDGLQTTGEGLEWGVLFGFGPGLTIETVVLHTVAT